jgi:hypothetical protein
MFQSALSNKELPRAKNDIYGWSFFRVGCAQVGYPETLCKDYQKDYQERRCREIISDLPAKQE